METMYEFHRSWCDGWMLLATEMLQLQLPKNVSYSASDDQVDVRPQQTIAA
jgi:hypothetical protein